MSYYPDSYHFSWGEAKDDFNLVIKRKIVSNSL
jgi:hypothetical protein